MLTTTQWIFEQVDKTTAPMRNIIRSSEKAAEGIKYVGEKAGISGSKIKKNFSADKFAEFNDAVQNIAHEFEGLNAPGAAFDAKLKEIEATLGILGNALDELGLKSKKVAKEVGINYDLIADKTVPFIERLKELTKAQSDSILVAQIFGGKNQDAVNTILDYIPSIEKLQGKIVGTNTTFKQADTVMSSYNERIAMTKTWFNNLAIGAFNVTSKMTPFVEVMSGTISSFANLKDARKEVNRLFTTLKSMPVIGNIIKAGSTLASGGFRMMRTAAKTFGVAIMNIPIIGWIAAIVAALGALGVHFWKNSQKFREVLMGTWEVIKTTFLGLFKFIGKVMGSIWKLIKGAFNPKNWFRKSFSIKNAFSEAMTGITDAAKEYGTNVGKAYGEGAEKGAKSWEKAHPEEYEKKKTDESQQHAIFEGIEGKDAERQNRINMPEAPEAIIPGASSGLKLSPRLNPSDLTLGIDNPDKNTSISGKHGSQISGRGIKSITQKIDIKNYFTVNGDANKNDFESIAEKIVRAINEKLSDSIVVAS